MRTQLDPFASVRLSPLAGADGLSARQQAVILTVRGDDGTEREETVGRTGMDYELVTNRQVVDTTLDILGRAFPGTNLKSDRVLFDGMRFEMRWRLPVGGTVRWFGVTDHVCMTAAAQNCYGAPRSSRLKLNALVHECANGCVISLRLGEYRLEQFEPDTVEYSEQVGRIAEEILSNKRWDQLVARFNEMAATPLSEVAIMEFERHLGLPEGVHEDMRRRLDGDTEWNLYMAATAALRDEPSFEKEELNRQVSLYFLQRHSAPQRKKLTIEQSGLACDLTEVATEDR